MIIAVRLCQSSDLCGSLATQVALLQVTNPSDAHPQGIQRKVPLCEYHAVRSVAWALWPIENDEEYGVALGAAGRPMYTLEVARAWGEISDQEYVDRRDHMIANHAPEFPSHRWSLTHQTRERRATERAEAEARAAGRIQDPVPIGSDRPEGKFGGVTSPVRRAERAVRLGHRRPGFIEAVLGEISRLNDTKRRRAAIAHIDEANRQHTEGLITREYRDRMISETLDSTRHVSLAK